ncbi:SGNH hydrolase [Leptospira kmetyi]|uniref:SGNH hydrolase n=1 Tax=Leptospira kmetyi TaxID=408139 RepID=A0A2M9XM80_9LEPT|nr:GDSL-type esterase/lipase family protein [Leptospira kmetyi]AYV54277.1 SGNH hydrolase [Leptospira kmetyi]PJZ40417.1 SGNH hydrolase [Leptospira kmetyi]TGL69095.1 SGNH hydrolase [Leptospira kmetyi]
MAKYFFSLSLLFLFSSCSYLIKKSYTDDYSSPNFECWAGVGYRNSELFDLYKAGWTGVRNFYKDQNLKIKSANVVFVGNSLIHMFPNNLLEKEFPGAVNRGIGGDMTETLLDRIEEDVLVLNPKVIVLEIGGNDLLQSKCLNVVEGNLVRILDKIQGYNANIKVVVLGIPPVRHQVVNRVSPLINLSWISIIQSRKNVEFLDSWQLFRQKDVPVLAQEFWPGQDKIHINENAYKIWVDKLKPILLPYL